MERQFSDDKGKSKIVIEGDGAPLNLNPNCNYVISNRPKKQKSNVKMADIGVKSNGFAAVATLAVIIALAGVIIAYLALRY